MRNDFIIERPNQPQDIFLVALQLVAPCIRATLPSSFSFCDKILLFTNIQSFHIDRCNTSKNHLNIVWKKQVIF